MEKNNNNPDARLAFRRFKAPRKDGGLLLQPPWPDCLAMAAENSERISSHEVSLLDRGFQRLREQARTDLFQLAKAYTSQYADVGFAGDHQADIPYIVSGHQPQLFHPGVWAKNFAVDRLAKQCRGLAIQVVIDNDVMRSPSVLCPSGTFANPVVVSESFDTYADSLPYEARFVQDLACLKTFPSRVGTRLSNLVRNPLVHVLWPHVVEQVSQGRALGPAMAIGRSRIEREWGLDTVEVPLSQLCDTDSFRWFALTWFVCAEEFRATYNRRLEEYRRVHRIRNHAQPLPDLGQDTDWIETPFWIWTKTEPTRRAAWVRASGNGIEITNRQETWQLQAPWPLALEQLSSHASAGFCLRPRALTNTLYLRLFCADVFVHGIGGGKYDQITDLIAADLFGIEPPGFIVLSLTTLMPSPIPLVELREIIHKHTQIRQMHFHPERFLQSKMDSDDHVSSKVKSKIKLIGEKPPRGQAAAWNQRMARVNSELRDFLQEKTGKEKSILSSLRDQERASRVLGSREWSFCLFDEAFVKSRLLDLDYHVS